MHHIINIINVIVIMLICDEKPILSQYLSLSSPSHSRSIQNRKPKTKTPQASPTTTSSSSSPILLFTELVSCSRETHTYIRTKSHERAFRSCCTLSIHRRSRRNRRRNTRSFRQSRLFRPNTLSLRLFNHLQCTRCRLRDTHTQLLPPRHRSVSL